MNPALTIAANAFRAAESVIATARVDARSAHG